MKYNQTTKIVSIVIFIALLMALLYPFSVLADDTTPPPAETHEASPPTEEPVLTAESASTAEPVVTEEPVIESSTTEPSATDVSSGDEGDQTGEVGDVDLSGIVKTAIENNVTLSDPSGEPLKLVTVDAAESLAAGDPYFTSGGVLYRFLPTGGCTAFGGVSATCTESSTPIQAALTFSQSNIPDLLVAPDGTLRRTIYVESGTYNEQVTINTGNLTLWGDPGALASPGAGASAPVLDGSTWASGDTGVTINAEGVTLIGFIIQNYDTAVSQPIVVGSNTITITQNTIQNNGEGIVILSDQGSPGTDVTYNTFQGNSSFDLVNGAPDDNNVQFVNAPNNYWGCSTGPVVAYRVFTGNGQNKVWTGQWGYIDWGTKHDYGVNGNGDDPNPDCAILYGSDSLFDFQINTSAYSPYKINIGTFITQIDAPALSLVKTAAQNSYSVVGQVINYSYLVTNSGNVNFAGPVTVADDKAAVTCPAGGLAPGASATCTAAYTITQADLDSGSVTNVATASANGTDSNQDSVTVTAAQSPALSIVKTAAPTTYSSVGQVINYSFVVTNTGNVTISGPFVVSDDKSTDESCPIALSLAPGASITCTASYTITQADLDAGSVTNVASATNGAVTSPSDSETVTAVQSSGLTIVKTATPTTYSAVGQVINYSYLVTNTSNITLSGPFIVSDDKSTDESCPITLGLAPGASITCTASYTITQTDLDGGSVTNIAFATNGSVTSPSDSETVTAVQSPALTLVKSATPITYSIVGQTISYSYLVTNTGNVTFAGPVGVADDKAVVTCPAVVLAPGVSVTCTASYTITQADLNSGSVTNIAQAYANGTHSNIDSVTVTAVLNSGLSIVKTATPTTYSTVGQVINYSYLVTNSGNIIVTGPVTVTDDKAVVSCPAGDLGPGASLTCTATYTIGQADLDSGSVTNIAFATNGAVTSPPDSETVTAVQSPALSIVKTASPATYDSVGNVIGYSYLVTNTGNMTVAGSVTVTDDKATVSCPAGDLAPGASITCTASYIITQADLDAGSVTNTAFATNGSVTSPTDSETVTAIQGPALRLVKSAAPTAYSAVSQIISYSYLVTNTGNVTLSGPFTVTDDKAAVTCPAGGLAPGTSMTCTASYTVTQADLDSGSVTNIAMASANGIDSNPDNETVNAIQTPALTTLKTETSTGPYAVGDTIIYSIQVTNTGNVTLTGVTVTDNNAVIGTCTPVQPSPLAPGAGMTCSASHVVTQADIDNGSYVNTALGDSDQTAPTASTVTVSFTTGGNPPTPPVPPTNPKPDLPSTSFTNGLIPVTGGMTHAIAAGIAHTCAIMPDGVIQCWGKNDYGQLGDGTNRGSNVPVNVLKIGGGTTIVAGGNHTCVLSGSEVWCWGQNSEGQLGDGTRTDRNIPVKVLSGAVDITAGLDYTCAVMIFGQVYCWGDNSQGQLADGTRIDRLSPTLASLISSITNVDAGRNQSCGLTDAGLLRCLNRGTSEDLGGLVPVTGGSPEVNLDVAVNRFGSLVMGLIENGIPVEFLAGKFKAVDDVTHAIDVDSGLGHVCTLLDDGTVSCWGSNYYGQLGRGTLTSSQDPKSVMNVSGAWQLAVGKNHVCVLINSNTPGVNDIQCWGLNGDGQLGDGTYVNSDVPVYVK